MKCLLLIAVALVLMISPSFAKENVQLAVDAKAGVMAGAYGVDLGVQYKLPQMNNVYARLGGGFIDTKNVTGKNWRRIIPVSLNGIILLPSNFYAGAGLNYPVKVSDGFAGLAGYQVFAGAKYPMGEDSLFGEAGYQSIRTDSALDANQFSGLYLVGGYSYTLAKTNEEKVIVSDKPFDGAVKKVQWSTDAGAGLLAGGYSGFVNTSYKMPSMLGMKDPYVRAGLSYTDTKNITSKAWRKFITLNIDGICNFNENYYAGLGLNFPLKVSDSLAGSLGGKVFVGAQTKIGGEDRLYGEVGYSSLKAASTKAYDLFEGVYVMAGYKIALSTVFEKPKPVVTKTTVAEPTPSPVVEPAPEEKAPVESAEGIKTYTTKKGDTLWVISEKYLGTPYLYPKLMEDNGISDPRKLPIGIDLKIDMKHKKS